MKNMDILESLEQGDISVDKAISLLKKRNSSKMYTQKSGWFRINIKDEKHNFKFYFPISLLNFGMSMSKRVITSKFIKDNDGMRVAQNVLRNIQYQDLKSITKAIKNSGRTNLVEVHDGANIVSVRIV